MASLSSAGSRHDDQLLVEGLRRGGAEAMETLVDRYGARIYRVALRLLGDARDAEEVTQDVLMTVLRKIDTFRGDAALSSWLYRIAANSAYDYLRGRRRRAEVALEPLLPAFDEEGRHTRPVIDWLPRVEDPTAAGEVGPAIERALGRLPEEHRAVIVLRDIEELSNEEAAEALGLTVAALKSRLHRARLFLRQELADVFSARS